MLATQFQSTDARKAIPCLDEPNKRAQFKISIERQSQVASLANMQLDDEPVDIGYV